MAASVRDHSYDDNLVVLTVDENPSILLTKEEAEQTVKLLRKWLKDNKN